MHDKKKSNTTRTYCSRCGGYGRKVIVLTREVCKICSRQEGIKGSHRSKLCRKAAVELTEVSFTHSTDEVANHHRGKGVDGKRGCVKSKLIDCD